jgi:hypothetical protein
VLDARGGVEAPCYLFGRLASRVWIWKVDRFPFGSLLLYYDADRIRTVFKVRMRDNVPQSLPHLGYD